MRKFEIHASTDFDSLIERGIKLYGIDLDAANQFGTLIFDRIDLIHPLKPYAARCYEKHTKETAEKILKLSSNRTMKEYDKLIEKFNRDIHKVKTNQRIRDKYKKAFQKFYKK